MNASKNIPKNISKDTQTTLIAHRGYSGKFPENTLLAYQAAYAFGARWMECDIQLTENRVPVVHHDASLMRMSAIDRDIREISSKEFKQLSAHYPDRFGQAFYGNAFTSLKKLAKWIRSDADIKMFVEIKQESIDVFGVEECMAQVAKRILKIKEQVVIISFNDEIVEHAKDKYGFENGWVIPEWSDTVETRSKEIQPDYIFAETIFMPKDTNNWWQGNWQWAIYNVDEYTDLAGWIEKGMQFIETNEIGKLMNP